MASTANAVSTTYAVAGMSCGHCRTAIVDEVSPVAGVEAVDVDRESKQVTVRGTSVSDTAVRAAIDEAGYEAT